MSTHVLKKCEPYVRQKCKIGNSIAFVPTANKQLSQRRLTVTSQMVPLERKNNEMHTGMVFAPSILSSECVRGILSSAPMLLSYFTKATKPAAREVKRAVLQAPLLTGVTFVQGGHVVTTAAFVVTAAIFVVVDFAVVSPVAKRLPEPAAVVVDAAVAGCAVVVAALVVGAAGAKVAATHVQAAPWEMVTMAAKTRAVRTELAMTATRRSRINPNVCPQRKCLRMLEPPGTSSQ